MTADPQAPGQWRYYPALRTWARGDRFLVVEQCPSWLDHAEMMRLFGVIQVGRMRCEREVRHDEYHRSGICQWSQTFSKEYADV